MPGPLHQRSAPRRARAGGNELVRAKAGGNKAARAKRVQKQKRPGARVGGQARKSQSADWDAWFPWPGEAEADFTPTFGARPTANPVSVFWQSNVEPWRPKGQVTLPWRPYLPWGESDDDTELKRIGTVSCPCITPCNDAGSASWCFIDPKCPDAQRANSASRNPSSWLDLRNLRGTWKYCKPQASAPGPRRPHPADSGRASAVA
jgi:hypothetical protein